MEKTTFILFLLIACGDDAPPAWAVQHASIVPGDNGMTGTQTWEFFASGWTPDSGSDAFLCARAQTLEATVTSSDECPACQAVYALSVTELDSDCSAALVAEPSFAGPDVFAIGKVAASLADAEPHPGEGFGWAVGYADGTLTDVGYAYAEALDVGGKSPAGWATDTPYTLWPAVAWEL